MKPLQNETQKIQKNQIIQISQRIGQLENMFNFVHFDCNKNENVSKTNTEIDGIKKRKIFQSEGKPTNEKTQETQETQETQKKKKKKQNSDCIFVNNDINIDENAEYFEDESKLMEYFFRTEIQENIHQQKKKEFNNKAIKMSQEQCKKHFASMKLRS